MTFQSPVRDLLHTLVSIVGLGGPDDELDRDTIGAILDAAGVFANEVLAPINRDGDRHGARLEADGVRTAPGFPDAYRRFADGGWTGLAADPSWGGQGLPKALELAVFEMVHAANMAFGLCPMLTQGAIEALAAHGSDAQQRRFLPRMISGEWTGAMNLTEPQAGTDLGAITTRAEPDGLGGYRLYGQKIFITWGDHDCADNIVHLVLARTPDAPAGSRGISLFVAPKRLVGADGALGGANALKAVGVEHKLGIHGSPTCVMLYEGAEAELVGSLNQGLAHMFTMMNAARLSVGVQGVAIAERAYQQALAYALDRRQGRSAWTGEASAPIFAHPDVRRMLADMKSRIEAARAICLLTAANADRAQRAEHEEDRVAARLREEFLTPIAKAWSTDLGVEAASTALQIHGGMGFIEETGAAQHYRDARIAPIYEGTNGVQAMDLAGRKLGMAGGEAARALFAELRADVDEFRNSNEEGVRAAGAALDEAAAAAQAATDWMASRRGEPAALAGASAYLALMGDVIGGWLLARGAQAAANDPAFAGAYASARAALAHHYARTTLSRTRGLAQAVTAGDEVLSRLDAAALGA